VTVPAASLREVLALDALGGDRFVESAPAPSVSARLFGGFVAGQCLRAATLTVDAERAPHSVHACFLRGGHAGVPVELAVERVRDGRSFATRRVQALQEGEVIAVLDASFQGLEQGEVWQEPAPTGVEPPGAVPGAHRLTGGMWSELFEVVPAVAPPPGRPMAMHPCWVRVRHPLGDDPAVHACALVTICDMGMLGSSRNWQRDRDYTGASLDHAVWLHQPHRFDGWLLLTSDPVTYAAGRGLVHGRVHDQLGARVASMSQEGLMRPTGTTGPNVAAPPAGGPRARG
jgi:acyl-CoA thioesterase-2